MSQAMNMMTDMAMQSARQNNLDTERSRLNNIGSSAESALKEKELRKAAEGFEAIFIQKIWDEMRSSLPKNGMHYSKEEEYWQSMYSQELGKSMASAGGIGLADMMVEQLTKPAVVSPQTGALSRIRMAVEPAPLVPETGQSPEQAKDSTKTQNTQASQNAHNISAAQTLSRGSRDLAPNFYEEFNPQAQAAAVAASAAAQQNRQEQRTAEQNQQADSGQNQQQQQEQAAQPQVIRTTYITNLPPEKRSYAILDKKGNPVKKTEAVRAKEISVPTQNDYVDRGLSIKRTIKAESIQNSDIIINKQAGQQAQPEQSAPQHEENTQDILAGITTTYIPYRLRMERQAAMQKIAEAVQADPAVPVQAKASQAQNQRTFRLPSLEEALNMGTLVASISDEELAGVQARRDSLAGEVSAAKADSVKTAETAGQAQNGRPVQNAAAPRSANPVSALAPQTDFAMPVAGTITSSFGWRLDPATRQRAWHKGIDLEAAAGSAVTAGRAGVVKFAGNDPELGNTVILDHGNGIESVYGHAGELSVKTGDVISSGTQIAKMGTNTNAGTGTGRAALHFEIRQNGLSINPEPYFSKEEIS